MAKKKVPEINGSSMADIAFIALIFFLMVTTMDKEEGISRLLPPIPPEDQKVENQEVNRRNIIQVKINSNDRLLAGSQPMDVSQLKDKIKEFMTNPYDDPNLPEKKSRISRVSDRFPLPKASSRCRTTAVPRIRPTSPSRTS